MPGAPNSVLTGHGLPRLFLPATQPPVPQPPSDEGTSSDQARELGHGPPSGIPKVASSCARIHVAFEQIGCLQPMAWSANSATWAFSLFIPVDLPSSPGITVWGAWTCRMISQLVQLISWWLGWLRTGVTPVRSAPPWRIHTWLLGWWLKGGNQKTHGS